MLHTYQQFSYKKKKSGRYVLIGQLLLQVELVNISKVDIHINTDIICMCHPNIPWEESLIESNNRVARKVQIKITRLSVLNSRYS